MISELDYFPPEKTLPEIFKQHADADTTERNFKMCPAFRQTFNNTFSLKYCHDYEIQVRESLIYSDNFNQDYFDSQVRWRTLDKRSIALNLFYLFVSEKPLTMNVWPSFFDDNSFNEAAILIPGKFDIGRWVRPVEFSFNLRKSVDKVQIKKGDAYCYVNFETDEKVTLKRFNLPNEMRDKVERGISTFHRLEKPYQNLIPFYDALERSKLRKYYIKTIKDNLLD